MIPAPAESDYHFSGRDFTRQLQEAAKAAFPSQRISRYNSVHVLMLRWETDNRPEVIQEMNQLQEVFSEGYGFQVATYLIPAERSHLSLNKEISKFVDIDVDQSSTLKIVYYSGCSSLTDDRQSVWTSPITNEQSSKPSVVKWTGIQMTLDEARSDILFLLDTPCWSSIGSGTSDYGDSVREVIYASSYGNPTDPTWNSTFTKCLIKELKLKKHGKRRNYARKRVVQTHIHEDAKLDYQRGQQRKAKTTGTDTCGFWKAQKHHPLSHAEP
ncbi:hypothetical protein IFR05_001673 [Cadophora sp. M221]|nr:hypothetical protein IFR05_001673 [Cadophora sp. M221]